MTKNLFVIELKTKFKDVASADSRLEPLMKILAAQGISPVRGKESLPLLKAYASERGSAGLRSLAELIAMEKLNKQAMNAGIPDMMRTSFVFACDDGKAAVLMKNIESDKACHLLVKEVAIRTSSGDKKIWKP